MMLHDSPEVDPDDNSDYIKLFDAFPTNHLLLQGNSPHFTILAVTPKHLAETGMKKEALVGKSIFEAYHGNANDPDDDGVSSLRSSLQHVLLHKQPHVVPELRYSVAGENGTFTQRYWSANNSPVFDKQGRVIYIIHTAEEITDKLASEKKDEAHLQLKKAYRQIEDSAEDLKRFKFMADNAQDAFILMRQDGTFAYLNQKALDAWGYTEEEAKGIRVPDVDPIYNDEIFSAAFAKAQVDEIPTFETLHKRKDGFIYPVEVKMGGIKLQNAPHMLAVARNITERRHAEEAIRQSETNLRNTILQAPVSMAILKGPTFIVDIANDAMHNLWGRTKEELQNKSIFEGLPEAKDQGFEQLLTAVYTTGERFSAQGVPVNLPRKGGLETVYINLLYEAFREADGTISGVIAVATDVTEQVLSRMKIEESYKDFQFVTDFVPQIIWVTRPDGYHYYYNKQWYDYTGLTFGETEGEGWKNVFHSDDQERASKQWQHSLSTGDPYEIEYRCRRYDGKYRWVLGRALPLKDETGNILKWFGTCTDIHEQKTAIQKVEALVDERTKELALANETLQSTNKELQRSNQNLQEFAYAASHDLKEPIRKMQVFGDRIKESLGEGISERERFYFERMEAAGIRMGALIDNLLSFSQVSMEHDKIEEEVDLSEILDVVLDDLEIEIQDQHATIEREKLCVIKGHQRQLQQAIQNLVANALKYSKPDDVPRVQIKCNEEIGRNVPLTLPEKDLDRGFHWITIQDNGIGFEQEYAETIFNVFTRLHTSSTYKGTGIGLSIVRKVIENHQGYIWANSEPGEGATFNVLLPVE